MFIAKLMLVPTMCAALAMSSPNVAGKPKPHAPAKKPVAMSKHTKKPVVASKTPKKPAAASHSAKKAPAAMHKKVTLKPAAIKKFKKSVKHHHHN